MSLPTRRAVLAVCVALLLVTAGCTTGATPTSTTTPTPTSTWSPNASVDQYPPGVADNGTLTNVSALADAHFEATANEPMVFPTVGASERDHRPQLRARCEPDAVLQHVQPYN